MTYTRLTVSTVSALVMLASVQAEIVDDGKWTGNDWCEASAVGVCYENGVPRSSDPVVAQRITSPKPVDGHTNTDKSKWWESPNVQLVQEYIPDEGAWEAMFPERNALYDYNSFLQAVAKFPMFCGESPTGADAKKTCGREIATLFAHFTQETGLVDTNKSTPLWKQGLYHIGEMNCVEGGAGRGSWQCDYKSVNWSAKFYPATAGIQYYGRGPIQLSWNYNYGAFSNIFTESTYDSKLYMLENPEQAAADGYTAFAAGLWFYMTPQSPKPSMHDVATGFYVPNQTDQNAGMKSSNGKNCFGITTNIINGGLECGQSKETYGSQHRLDYYKEWLNLFRLADEDFSAGCGGCGGMAKQFPENGAGHTLSYFDQENWNGVPKCKLVSWQTGYSLYARDDYKRCICDKFGSGAADCATKEKVEIESESEDTEPEESSDEDVIGPDIDPALLSYGIQCTNPYDGKCGTSCDSGCFWSWPTSDSLGCMAPESACRCKPAQAEDFMFVKLCENECASDCTNCAFSWPKTDTEKFKSSEAKCRCADQGLYFYPG